MRQIRLEEINEAVLPEIIQSISDSVKNSDKMEMSKTKSKNKCDKVSSGNKSNYREDEAVK